MTNYELIKTTGASCPHCGHPTRLFCPIKFDATKPAHYLCFTCGCVAQVGGGTENHQSGQQAAAVRGKYAHVETSSAEFAERKER